MKRLERTPMSAEAQRELEAIDAALRGGSVATGHLPLAELAVAARALRPRPSDEFVHALDARAAHGFRSDAKPERPSRRRRPARPHGETRSRRLPTALAPIAV